MSLTSPRGGAYCGDEGYMADTYFLNDSSEDKSLLGNKGANLVAMARLVAAQTALEQRKAP